MAIDDSDDPFGALRSVVGFAAAALLASQAAAQFASQPVNFQPDELPAFTVCNTTSPSGNVLVVTGLTETLLPGCSVSIGAGRPSADLVWDIWVSQNRFLVVKQATLRLRRTDVTGAILASRIVPDTGDSAGGHQYQWAGFFFDPTPTDGVYVLTVQETLGDATTEIWSDTRTFCITSPGLGPRIRVTQEVVEVVHDGAPNIRATQEVIEAVHGGTPNIRVTQEVIEVVNGANPNIRVTQFCIELVMRRGGPRAWGQVIAY